MAYEREDENSEFKADFLLANDIRDISSFKGDGILGLGMQNDNPYSESSMSILNVMKK